MSKLGKRLITSAKQARAVAQAKAGKPRYDSVWDAIEPSRVQAANMTARAAMMIAIRETVAAWGLTQAATAKRLGLPSRA